MEIFEYEKYVLNLKNAAVGLKNAASAGGQEIGEIALRVKEIFLRERVTCMNLLRESDRYPDFEFFDISL